MWWVWWRCGGKEEDGICRVDEQESVLAAMMAKQGRTGAGEKRDARKEHP